MKNKLTVHIHPITQYLKSQKCDYTLCRIDFDFNYYGPVEHFEAECNNLCLQKMIKDLDTFLSGKGKPKEFHYEIIEETGPEHDRVFTINVVIAH